MKAPHLGISGPTFGTRCSRPFVVGWLVALGVLAVGCVPMEQQVPDRADVFEPLHEGRLSAFDHELAVETHAGRDDAWTDVGRALVQFANCEALSDEPPRRVEDHPRALVTWELLELEDRRRLRMNRRAPDGGPADWRTGTIHEQFSTPGFFDRTAETIDDELIRWPDRPESWPDEWPAPRNVEGECDRLADRDAPGELRAPFDELEPESPTGHLVSEWLQTRRVDAAIDQLEDDEPADRARRTVTAHRADLALVLADRDDARELAPETVDATLERTLDELLEIAESAPMDLDFAVRVARLATEIDNNDVAIRAYRRLMDHPTDSVAETSRYWATKLAWHQARFDDAAQTGRPLVDGSEPMRSAHAYFAATAHRRADREDEFLAVAREALSDRPRGTDPFLGALYREVLRHMTRYEVDERTEELLESLGPRAELTLRKREFAEVALDMGRPEIARQLVEPMVDDIRDARRLPRLHGILALAAFMRDDGETFDRHIAELTDRPAQLEEAIPRGRRAAFFAPRDTELARVLRATLPLMAEWGDDPGARQLRQQWLETLVEHTRTFLRETPHTAVSDELAELYRLASRLLEDHPRGYAERVGEQQPSASALVLGTVDMPPSPPLDEAPRPKLRWPPIPSLLLIPVGSIPPEKFSAELNLHGGESRN